MVPSKFLSFFSQAMPVLALLLTSFVCLPSSVIAAEPAHRLIVGWDDAVIVCGPGTVAGMDSPQAIERIVKRWKSRGIQGIYWRVDEAMLPDRFMTRWNPKTSPGMNYLLKRVDQKLHEFPVLKTLLAAAERERLEVWAWYPTIYSNGAPPTGQGFTQAWLYENKFGTDHPEVLSVDRAGNKHFMVWEYAYPEARKAKVSEFVQFARDYGFKKFVACLRTEAAQMQPAPKHADQFGFNAPVVAEMKKRHGIDILTDVRFDFSQPKFNVRDPLVESWRKLRGEYLTQFYRELRAALNEVDPAIQIAVQIPGDRAGTCLGNWHLDWRTWVDEGLVNELVVPVVLDGYEGYGPRTKLADFGYIDGAISAETVRQFVKQSRQPTARVIQAGGPATSYHTPPTHADGWRLDGWHDLWTYNMAERWEQWQRDFAEFGHIRFIEQSFDGFPEKSDGYGGGFGDFCHRPDLRSGPGYWEKIGDGANALPFAQSKTHRGKSGLAIQLTREAGGMANLTVRHHSRHDRGNFPFPGDTAIGSGSCQLDFWMLRPSEKSAFVAYLQYDIEAENRHDVGFYVAEGNPATIYFRENGKVVASSATTPVGQWQRLTLKVDLERQQYSAEIAAEGEAARVICHDVAYGSKNNAFNMLEFSPQGATGSELFLDDVSLRWTPSSMFEPVGKVVLAQAGFEQNERQAGSLAHTGDVSTDKDISAGPEYQSLRIRGAGGKATLSSPALKMPRDGTLLVDLDVLPKSDLRHLQITPSPDATSTDEVGFSLTTTDGQPVLAIASQDGHWSWRKDQVKKEEGEQKANPTVAWDAWHHFQIAIDVRARTYRVLMQVLGEPPRELCRGPLSRLPGTDSPLAIEMFCRRSRPRGDGPAFDNLQVTRRIAKEQP